MRTALYLLMLTEGKPVMTLDVLSTLLGINKRTIENKHYDKTLPVPLFKLGGGTWHAHVADVAKYIDDQRAAALKEFEAR